MRGTQLKAPKKPTAILVLGGEKEREEFAAEMALNERLEVWLTSGQIDAEQRLIEKLPASQFHLDWRALDTVTNFSTMIRPLLRSGVSSVYLVTSDYHMRRASSIAYVMLGASGISFEAVAVPTDPPKQIEPWHKVLRDVIRAVIWVLTGSDFRPVIEWFLPDRARISNEMSKVHTQDTLLIV
jgi:uncharacterized SAM-binding protein YcdF (DUF218 family)